MYIEMRPASAASCTQARNLPYLISNLQHRTSKLATRPEDQFQRQLAFSDAMPGERVVVDGLWRCLCPSVDVATLSKLIGPPRNPRRRPSPSLGSDTQFNWRQSWRQYRLVTAKTQDDRWQEERDLVEESRVQYLKRLAKRSPWIPGALLRGVDAFATKLDRIPTKTIYAALKELSTSEGTYLSIVKMVEYLVNERKEKPNALLYESLIRANVDKNHGSAQVALQLLREMDRLRIPTTPQIYQAILEVTAVHPDYVLRNTVLFEMKNRWYSPTVDDLVNIILGLLRDTQYELALEKLEELHKNPVIVPSWLYDIFLYTFGELGFHEETLSILKHRLRLANMVDEPLSPNAWHFLLDVFSRDAFYDGVKYIWDRSVTRGNLNPPDGVVMNILNTASNHADAPLAVSALQMLSNRGRKLELHHYEALIDIHTQQKDLRKAFTILCIMAKANLRPDLSSTRSIFRVIRDSSSETDRALEIISNLKSHYQVPSAAFNVVLEAIEAHYGFKVALDLYRGVRGICADGPDLETYHVLLRHCTMRKSMNFLFAEMEALSIEPSQTTYDHFIRISCMQDDYEQAFQFLEKMKNTKTAGLPNNWWMGRDAALALVRRCIQVEDIRVQELIEECRKRGMSIDSEVQEWLDDAHKQKELAETDVSVPAEEVSSTGPVTAWPLESVQDEKLDAMSDSA
ncbi:hypothetical protein F5Y05DRAFT_206992 [Hypoxylon sp. FL0543]|nr:hypothetical protein F5Y05DRAFT_206992 [Hypoxylon sp. FL0543]